MSDFQYGDILKHPSKPFWIMFIAPDPTYAGGFFGLAVKDKTARDETGDVLACGSMDIWLKIEWTRRR